MEEREEYPLILNHITAEESMMESEEFFEEYKRTVFFWLSRKDRHLFAEDILKGRKEITLEELMSYNPDQYIPGIAPMKKGDKIENTWYDIMGMDIIESNDVLFDFFFVCKLRHLDLFEIDGFLNYHLEESFAGDTEKFHRFLLLALRKYKQLLKTEHVDTVNEWMTSVKSKTELSGVDKTKGKLKRTAEDKFTTLNQEQSALLIHFLQEARIILKDEYLNNKQAGSAFSILTGYSADTLRQELGKNRANTKISKKNLTELYNAVTKLGILIDKQIKNS